MFSLAFLLCVPTNKIKSVNQAAGGSIACESIRREAVPQLKLWSHFVNNAEAERATANGCAVKVALLVEDQI